MLSDKQIIDKAIRMLEGDLSGGIKGMRQLIKPLVEKKNPDALFLNAQAGLPDETEGEFDKRRMDTFHELAKQDYAPALYELAVCYELGDYIEQDTHLSAQLYLKSMNLGYPNAKLYHGLNLFYGSHGIKQDKNKGLQLIKEAVDADVPLAKDIYDDLTQAS